MPCHLDLHMGEKSPKKQLKPICMNLSTFESIRELEKRYVPHRTGRIG